MLIAQQGGEYVPFLTNEANKALANMINSNKPMIDLLNLFKPNTTIMPHSPSDGISSHSVTVDEATKLIRENSQSMIEDTTTLDAEYTMIKDSIGLPDVSARNQDLSEIGIGRRKKKKAKKAIQPITFEDPIVAPGTAPVPSQHRKRLLQYHPNIITADEDFKA
jgi:hypothetical protein